MHESAPQSVTRQRIALFVVVSALLGLVLAAVLNWSFGSIAAFAIIPVAAAIACYLRVNRRGIKSTGSAFDAGPVLW